MPAKFAGKKSAISSRVSRRREKAQSGVLELAHDAIIVRDVDSVI
jgi:hypothetical protein